MSSLSHYAICFEGDHLRIRRIERTGGRSNVVFETRLEDYSHSYLVAAARESSDALLADGYSSQAVVICIGCYQSMMLECVESTKKGLKLEYQLEEFCPFDAENISAFRMSQNRVVIAVNDRVEPYVEELLGQGIQVKDITPLPVLLTQTLIEKENLPDDCCIRLTLNSESETIEVRERRIVNWICGENPVSQPPDFFIKSRIVTDESDSAIRYGKLLSSATHRLVANRFEETPATFDSMAGTPTEPPLIRSLKLFAVSAAFLLTLLSLANIWEVYRTNQTLHQVDDQITKLYQLAFPDAAPTRLVSRALEAESVKLSAQTELITQTQSTHSVVEVLQLLWESMPNDYSVEVNTIKINKRKLTVDGKVTDLKSLDMLRENIESFGFTANPNEQSYGKEFRLSYQLQKDNLESNSQPQSPL